MKKEYFGKIFSGPHQSAEAVINTGGVYLITPFIQTGSVQVLDVGQGDDLKCLLNDPDRIKLWATLARNFGGYNIYIHYEITEFARLTLAYQIRNHYKLPDRQKKPSPDPES
jgi:hypothetical protein